MIKFHYPDTLDNYTYVIKHLKDIILEEIDNLKNRRIRELEDKFVINFNRQ